MNEDLLQKLKNQEKLRDEFIQQAKNNYTMFAYKDEVFRNKVSMEQYVHHCLTSPLDVINAFSIVK